MGLISHGFFKLRVHAFFFGRQCFGWGIEPLNHCDYRKTPQKIAGVPFRTALLFLGTIFNSNSK